MDIRKYLRTKGIRYKEVRRPSGAQAVFPCPACQDKGFSINLDTGAFSCYKKNKCGISGGTYKFQILLGDDPKRIKTDAILEDYNLPKKKNEDPDENIKKFLESRGINFEKAVEHFKIMKLGDNIAFRYYDYGEHVATKYRKISTKEFHNEVGCRPALYNIDRCRKSDTLYMVEGELDCIALYQMTGINAVSVPNGTGDTRWVEYNWADLESFKQIVFIFDNDKAGQDSVKKLSLRLGPYRCANVILPHNDINDCLKAKMTSDEMCEKVFNPIDMVQSQVQSCKMYEDEIIEDILDPEKLRGIQLPHFPHFMSIFHGIRKPELTIITGQNHAGKSTVINQLMLNMVEAGERPGIASLEMPPRRYLRWLLMQATPATGQINPERVKKLLDYLDKRLYVIDIQGRVGPKELLQHMEIACRKHGVTQLFVDSLMKVKLDRKDLLGAQSDFVDDFIDLTREYDCHGWLIAHPRKGATDNDQPGKVDVGGAGHITNAADNVLTVWRPDEKTKESMRSQFSDIPASILSVKKCREYGEIGDIFLGYNDQNKKIFELKSQPE